VPAHGANSLRIGLDPILLLGLGQGWQPGLDDLPHLRHHEDEVVLGEAEVLLDVGQEKKDVPCLQEFGLVA
jgi:hypothetical protein